MGRRNAIEIEPSRNASASSTVGARAGRPPLESCRRRDPSTARDNAKLAGLATGAQSFLHGKFCTGSCALAEYLAENLAEYLAEYLGRKCPVALRQTPPSTILRTSGTFKNDAGLKRRLKRRGDATTPKRLITPQVRSPGSPGA